VSKFPVRWVPAEHRKAVAVLCAAAVLLVVVSVVFRPSAPAAKAASPAAVSIGFSQVNRPAPAFSLPQLDGHGTIGPGQLTGRPLVVNFWSSTCDVCQQESAALATVAHSTGGNVGFLGVDTADLRSSGQAFARHYHLPYQLAFDPNGVAAGRYAVPGLPTTYFLSRTGTRIVGVNVGALTVRTLTRILRSLYGSG
jgi:cytochrome c biogenesis protein CcmG/thiol:disulfide interchange protein DsbE